MSILSPVNSSKMEIKFTGSFLLCGTQTYSGADICELMMAVN